MTRDVTCSSAGAAFRTLSVGSDQNRFDDLLAAVHFEDVIKGRQGTVLVEPHPDRGTPVVRTTTKYRSAPQCFGPAHQTLARRIETLANLPTRFNNALIELYANTYSKMGFHSDQALDLEDESVVAIYSSYRFPNGASPARVLVVEPKGGGDAFEIPLLHDGVVLFSVEANSRFRHKIVLAPSSDAPENQWLGVTFRTSKTFVHVGDGGDGGVTFEDGSAFTLANEQEAGEFYRLRRRENQEVGFTYPRLTYTVSESDLMPPKARAR